MKKFLKYLSLLFIVILIIAIDLPENFHIKFNVGNKKIDYVINPLSINFNLFGLNINKSFNTKLGLDLKGGSHLVFEADINYLTIPEMRKPSIFHFL